MKKINFLLLIALACQSVFAQPKATKKKIETQKPPEVVAKPVEAESVVINPGALTPEMKVMMAYATPGKMHEMLSEYDGDWKEDVTFWMDAGAPPMQNTSTCSNNMIMEGRYQESRHIAMMNNMPFEGTGLLGYDNAKKVFVSTWVDNMGTGITYMVGTWDDANKTIHFTGTSVDPLSGKDLKVRQDLKFTDSNNQLLEMYTTKNGKEFKSMEIKFTR